MPRLNLNMYDIVTQDIPELDPYTETLTNSSPAMELFNKQSGGKPLLISSDLPALEAVKLLHSSDSKLHYVVSATNRFQGIIALENLNEIEFVIRTANGYTREELLVSDFMIPRKVLRAFDLEELREAVIGDVVASLSHSGAEYCLAVDRNNHRIRGLASRQEIEARLGIKIKAARASIMQMMQALHS